MKILGKELTFNGNKVYHTGNKPTASEIGAAASSHSHNYAGSSSAGGAANSANTLSTARTINGTSFNGSANITTANWGTARTITIGNTGKSVNGSANVSWSLSEIGAAAASHTHSYLPLSGGSMTGKIANSFTTNTYLAGNQGNALISSSSAAGSYVMLYRYPSTNGYFTTGGYQGSYLLQYTAKSTVDAGTNSVTKSVTLLDESGNSSFSGTVKAPTFSGALSGNASTATKLQTARTINGVSFDGSANITTANWGTSRNITMGNTTKSVNGSANVSWTLSEIGAAPASHSHSYLPLSGGTLTGNLTVQGQTTLGATVLNNNTSLYGYNKSGTKINICGIDTSNNIYLGWGNETYINVNNTMRTYRDLHVLNGAAMRVTGQTVLARTESNRQIAIVSTAGDENGIGDGQTHLGYFDNGYHHYFRGSGAMHIDMLGGLRIGGKRLSIGSAAHSNPYTGDVWIQV